MGEIEYLILLLAAAGVCVRFAERIAVPYPIVLVLGGLAIGLVPALPDLELDPEVVFLVFLPPLLQSAGYWASPTELRAELARQGERWAAVTGPVALQEPLERGRTDASHRPSVGHRRGHPTPVA